MGEYFRGEDDLERLPGQWIEKLIRDVPFIKIEEPIWGKEASSLLVTLNFIRYSSVYFSPNRKRNILQEVWFVI